MSSLFDDTDSMWEYMSDAFNLSEILELSYIKLTVILISIIVLVLLRLYFGRNMVAVVVVFSVVFFKWYQKRIDAYHETQVID